MRVPGKLDALIAGLPDPPPRGTLRELCEAHSFDIGRNCTYEELVVCLVHMIKEPVSRRETEGSKQNPAL